KYADEQRGAEVVGDFARAGPTRAVGGVERLKDRARARDLEPARGGQAERLPASLGEQGKRLARALVQARGAGAGGELRHDLARVTLHLAEPVERVERGVVHRGGGLGRLPAGGLVAREDEPRERDAPGP